MSHQTISFVKSFFRLVGYALIPGAVVNPTVCIVAAMVLIFSEILGVVEEIGH
jgi:hypothetical protein